MTQKTKELLEISIILPNGHTINGSLIGEDDNTSHDMVFQKTILKDEEFQQIGFSYNRNEMFTSQDNLGQLVNDGAVAVLSAIKVEIANPEEDIDEKECFSQFTNKIINKTAYNPSNDSTSNSDISLVNDVITFCMPDIEDITQEQEHTLSSILNTGENYENQMLEVATTSKDSEEEPNLFFSVQDFRDYRLNIKNNIRQRNRTI